MSIRAAIPPILPTASAGSALSELEHRIGLVDAPSPPELSALVSLLAQAAQVPVALVSIVQRDRDRQYFAAAHGLTRPWCERRQTPLSHSFCKHVAETGAPLVVANAREAPLVRDTPAIDELGVVAYLGVPIHWVDGTPIGALCAIDSRPRAWSEADRTRLEAFAVCVNGHIRMLHALHERQLAMLEIDLARRSQRMFLAQMHHELRTPLNGVLGMAETLRDDPDSEDRQVYLDVLADCAGQLRTLMEDAMAVSEGFAPGRPGRIEAFDVALMLQEVASVLALHASSARVRIRATPGFASCRRGDRVRIRHIVYDALRAALSVARDGTVFVSLAGAPGGDVELAMSTFPASAATPAGPPPPAPDLSLVESLLSAVGGCLHRVTCQDGRLTLGIRVPLPAAGA